MAHFTTSDGLKLYYSDAGTGLPILCLAGLTRNSGDFDYVTPHLAGHRLIKLDARGRGQSDHDPEWQNYALPIEIRDVIELLDHLSLARVAIIGSSRGGLNAMGLAMVAKDRVTGVALNDVGPVLDEAGIELIKDYIGRPPAARTHAEAAAAMARFQTGFKNVPEARWLAEAHRQFTQTEDGLALTYDPHLRDAVLAAGAQTMPDLWPYFDALDGLPLALIWGENSNLVTATTVAQMQARRPDMILARVPDRGHIPFLDEPQSLAALNAWLEALA